MFRRIETMRGITLTAAMVVLTMSSTANAGLFGLFGHKSDSCSEEPSCCAPAEADCSAPAECVEPTCCAPAEASCCAPAEPTCCAPAACGDEGCDDGCSVPKMGGLFSKIKNIFKRNKGCGDECSSEPSCCAPAEATCCAPAEPSCCAPAEADCSAPAGCN